MTHLIEHKADFYYIQELKEAAQRHHLGGFKKSLMAFHQAETYRYQSHAALNDQHEKHLPSDSSLAEGREDKCEEAKDLNKDASQMEGDPPDDHILADIFKTLQEQMLLHIAVKWSAASSEEEPQLEVTDFLIQKGFNVNGLDGGELPPLHYVRSLKVFEHLLEHGANPFYKNRFNVNATHHAARLGDLMITYDHIASGYLEAKKQFKTELISPNQLSALIKQFLATSSLPTSIGFIGAVAGHEIKESLETRQSPSFELSIYCLDQFFKTKPSEDDLQEAFIGIKHLMALEAPLMDNSTLRLQTEFKKDFASAISKCENFDQNIRSIMISSMSDVDMFYSKPMTSHIKSFKAFNHDFFSAYLLTRLEADELNRSTPEATSLAPSKPSLSI